jgi:hypothetical protein
VVEWRRKQKGRRRRGCSSYLVAGLRGSVLLVDVVVVGRGGVAGGALVGHLGVVTVLPVGGVTDDLGAAVGEQHAVLATHDVSVGGGVVREVSAVVVVLDGVVEVVGHAGLVVVVLKNLDQSKSVF